MLNSTLFCRQARIYIYIYYIIFFLFLGKGRVSSPSLNIEKSKETLLGASGSEANGDSKLKPRSRYAYTNNSTN